MDDVHDGEVLEPGAEVAKAVSQEQQLAACEARIEGALRSFYMETGEALTEIRDSRLYLLAGYDTFDGYVSGRWSEMSRQHAYRLMDAAAVAGQLVSPIGDKKSSEQATFLPLPANEAQARALKGAGSLAAEIWQQAYQDSGGRPTAASIKAAVEAARVGAGLKPATPGKPRSKDTGQQPAQKLQGTAQYSPSVTAGNGQQGPGTQAPPAEALSGAAPEVAADGDESPPIQPVERLEAIAGEVEVILAGLGAEHRERALAAGRVIGAAYAGYQNRIAEPAAPAAVPHAGHQLTRRAGRRYCLTCDRFWTRAEGEAA